jgi:starch phosphorylase
MRIVRRFAVVPHLPDPLKPLREIAFNLWWSWDYEAIALFQRTDPDGWERCEHNPVLMLGEVDQTRLDALAADESFLAHLRRVRDKLQEYLDSPRRYPERSAGGIIAYFSAEFGLSECLPVYSGGLGVLAGDHLKSASDLGLPLVGVGLLYREGYFRQYLNADGWQQEFYPQNDFFNMPVERVRAADGSPLTIEFRFQPHRPTRVQVWRVQVGRVPLYMLDTNLPENAPEDRDVTAQLYGGDQDMRVRQEMLLGMGGLEALATMGVEPTVCHMNEGHSSFLAVERCRRLMKKHGCSFAEAWEAVYAGNCFTSHTPVPAGNDSFHRSLMEKYFGQYHRDLGVSFEDFLRIGRQDPGDPNEPFGVTVLALRLAGFRNGVSRLHGEVSREMWKRIWKDVPVAETPIISITNGVHTRTWISSDLAGLLDRYLGPRWISSPSDPMFWARVEQIPDSELWRTHERRRERLVAFARRRLRRQLERRGAPPAQLLEADEVLDPEKLTVGFARRFATYKRATLLFEDLDRLTKILTDPQRQVQLIYAGKAHPRDQEGKDLIRQITHISRRPALRRHIVFIEDYDLNVARYMTQGCDVWLNTPMRPLEASGTSGMKATANGALNISIPDGWWAEAARQDNGWTIGRGEQYGDIREQNAVESAAIYDLFEKEVTPLFYQRGADGLPRDWIRRMKTAMRTICPIFNTHRMVQQYAEWAYFPAMDRWNDFIADGLTRARALAAWRQRMQANWAGVRIMEIQADGGAEVDVGDSVVVSAHIHLGPIKPDDVRVEIYSGVIGPKDNLERTRTSAMKYDKPLADGAHVFAGRLQFRTSGQHGFGLRVAAQHPDLINLFDTGLLLWA